MVDIAKQTVDGALDEHTFKIQTEVLWIKGKYEEKLEVRMSGWQAREGFRPRDTVGARGPYLQLHIMTVGS